VIGYMPMMDSGASGMKRATLSDQPKPADGSIDVFQLCLLSAVTMEANVLDDDGAAYDS
jgi:hypothetical protein